MRRQLLRNIGIFILLIIILAVSSGCNSKPEPRQDLSNVQYSVICGEKVTLTTELPGRVSPLMLSEVRPQVSGIIQERLFEEGTDVQAGQILYRIDPSLFQASYNNAKANLTKAEANELSSRLLAERYGKIVKSSAVSRQEYDNALAAHAQAKAEVESAQQALETARINLGYTEVTAPVSGRIGRSFVTPGALVTQNQAEPLASIQHLATVYVDMSQSNNEILKLRRAFATGDMQTGGEGAAKVRLKLEDGSPYAKPARVAASGEEPDWVIGDLLFSDVTVEKSTGAVNIRARFENPANILLPGMYVRAVVEEGVLENAVLVPQKTVMRDTRGRPYVYVLIEEQNKTGEDTFEIAMRHVSINRNVGAKWLISSGLEPGDLLLIEGHMKTRPGKLVSGTPVAFDEVLSASREETTKMR